MGSIVTGNLQPNGLPYEAGYTNGFLLLSGTSIAAFAAALVVPSVRRAHRPRLKLTACGPQKAA